MSTLVHRIGLLSGVEWTPEEIGAFAWYDPSDMETVWQNSARTTPGAINSPVGALDDQSGNGHHFIQATAAQRPILRADGDRRYLEFDSVDDYLQTAAFGSTLLQPNHLLIGLRPVSSSALGEAYLDGIASGAQHQVYTVFVSGEFIRHHMFAGLTMSGPFVERGVDNTLAALFNGAASVFRRDNGSTDTGDAGAQSLTGLTLGATYSGSSPFDGRVYGLIVYNGELTGDDFARALGWLDKRTKP